MAEDFGRASLVRNPDYKRDGFKSYMRALQKYDITPTVEGPYSGRPGEVQVRIAQLSITYIALKNGRLKMSSTMHCT